MNNLSRLASPVALLSRLTLVGGAAIFFGCDGGPAASPGAQPPGAAQVAAQPPVAEARNPYGLSARAAYLAFADTASSISKEPSPFRFADIREGSGIDFVHVSGSGPEKFYPTAFGSGVALFDSDGDGRLDVYLASYNPMPPGTPPGGRNRLYRNLGGGKFRDVTDASGLGYVGHCHGIIAGDVDNDGDADVFLCNHGNNALFLNDGRGTYRDVSHDAGVDAPGWSLGGAMLDYDGDGDLDIYVARYGDWQYPRDAKPCGSARVPLFCSPWSIRTARHILYRNDGPAGFRDVTEAAGLGRSDGHGFGAVASDLNGDGRVDLYVANDMDPNFLFLNRGDGTFADATESSGAAYDNKGIALASMGVDAEDCDGDGRPELLTTNFQDEHIGYYRNLQVPAPSGAGRVPPATFRESSAEVGLVADSRPWIGWGCALADFDADGWPDLFVANGHVDHNRKDLAPTMSYEEPPLLYRNVAGAAGSGPARRFQLSTRDVGPYFATRHVGRGAAFGDLDDDGDVDIVVSHMDGPPALLRNDTPGDRHWIRLEFVGTRSNRDAIGARVEVEAGGRTIVRHRKGGGSLGSSHDPRPLIGVGRVDAIDRVTVHWPSGAVSLLEHPKLDSTHKVVEPQATGSR